MSTGLMIRAVRHAPRPALSVPLILNVFAALLLRNQIFQMLSLTRMEQVSNVGFAPLFVLTVITKESAIHANMVIPLIIGITHALQSSVMIVLDFTTKILHVKNAILTVKDVLGQIAQTVWAAYPVPI